MWIPASDHRPQPCSLPHSMHAVSPQVHLPHQASQVGAAFGSRLDACCMKKRRIEPMRPCHCALGMSSAIARFRSLLPSISYVQTVEGSCACYFSLLFCCVRQTDRHSAGRARARVCVHKGTQRWRRHCRPHRQPNQTPPPGLGHIPYTSTI